MATSQLHLDLSPALPAETYDYGVRTSGETHGVVLTKPHVVELILNLADYVETRDLAILKVLEPACGHGAFLLELVNRLMKSARKHERTTSELENSLLAYDIDPDHVAMARKAVIDVLLRHEISESAAKALAHKWVQCGDFLLAPRREADLVVGNPPYIRIEQVPPELQAEYRQRFTSLFDRADLYVAFIEKGLDLLTNNGVLAFICADRWILNRYGAPLRGLLTEKFRVRYYIDLNQASPFDTDVIAYPSIFVFERGAASSVCVAKLETASVAECKAVIPMITGETSVAPGVTSDLYNSWFRGDEPWVISTPSHLRVLRELEANFLPIESDGTKVGIGVATGNDRVFIVSDGVDIEKDRLVPLVLREDIDRGQIKNARRAVLNTFSDDGGVIELEKYPKLARYVEMHAADIKQRHVAKKNPRGWFRTIDRVYPQLVTRPKLLIPDIAGSNEVVFDPGQYHPHHNLYFITSDSWDMEVLGGLLSSKVVLFFVWSYAVKMRGNYLRFQAQYLRRIRLPSPGTISPDLFRGIRTAFRERDFKALDTLSLQAYGIRQLPDFDFVDTRK